MENIYFKGLEKALNDGCYIKVFSCSLRYPVVRVEKKNDNKEELISYAEGGNVISTLNEASNNIINEISDNSKPIFCDNTLIDNVVGQGYTLHFYKLSNKQVLSTICDRSNENGTYIPLKSVITDDIKTGFETLNVSLSTFDFECPYDFYDFAKSQTSVVEEYQKSLKK